MQTSPSDPGRGKFYRHFFQLLPENQTFLINLYQPLAENRFTNR